MMLKSKKGIGTSVAVDVLMIVAYLVFFIGIVFAVSTKTPGMTTVSAEQAAIGHQLELVSALKTPLEIKDSAGTRETTFAYFLADVLDACPPPLSPQTDPTFQAFYAQQKSEMQQRINEDYSQFSNQMKLFFDEFEKEGACIGIESSEKCDLLDGIASKIDCPTTAFMASMIPEGKITIPTREGNTITFNVYHLEAGEITMG